MDTVVEQIKPDMSVNLEPKVSPLHTPRSARSTILLIGDDPSGLDIIVLALREEGYQVVLAQGRHRALEVLESDQRLSQPTIGLVILDQAPPYSNWLDLCRIIRHNSNWLPILMLSSSTAEADVVLGLEVGADQYLAKPFGIRELIARCRALLRSYQASLPTGENLFLQYGGLVLFPQEHRVTKDGQEVMLSPKEFKLLEALMRHPRKVLSRDQLLDWAWGSDYWGDPKTVDVHIRWLREKLESNPQKPQYIKTLRGFGYRLG